MQTNSLHIRLLQGRGDVHVHVQEALHGPTLLRLLNLQLGQEADEPLKGPLLPVDPVKVNLERNEKLGYFIHATS